MESITIWCALLLGANRSLPSALPTRWLRPPSQMASISYQGLESYLMVQDHVKMHDIGDWLEHDLFPNHSQPGDIFFVSAPPPPYGK